MIEALERSEKLEVVCVRIKENRDIPFKNQIIVPPVVSFLSKDPFRLFFTLPRAIRRLHPDVVIEPAHFGPFNLPKQIKRVTVIHDLTPVMFPQWHNRLSSILQRIFLPSILKKATLIITNSDNTSHDLIQTYPQSEGKIARIYPLGDPFFHLEKEELVDEKQPFFLSVGTIEPRKNLSLLLDAYQLFREQTHFSHQLIICGGDGWKNTIFFEKLENHPFKKDIQWKGYVSREELKQLYSNTTAFIFPSLYEGFGFPVAEAMGCGAPCIVSNRSSLPEVGGDAVLYFDPEEKMDLVSKLIEVASSKNLVSSLGQRGNVRANSFSPERFQSELEKFLIALK